MSLRAISAELIGSFTYVAALFSAFVFAVPAGGGLLTVALAPGLAFIAMSYAVGHVSGGHFNPAVTLGLVAAGRFERGEAVAYISAQLTGAIAAAALIFLIRSEALGGTWPGFAVTANTFGGEQFSLPAVMLVEWLASALLVIVFMGATSGQAPSGVAPLAIGFSITMLHLMTLAISNAGFNPARATAAALFADTRALSQLWVFWAAPIVGAVTGGLLARWLNDE